MSVLYSTLNGSINVDLLIDVSLGFDSNWTYIDAEIRISVDWINFYAHTQLWIQREFSW